MLHIIVVLIVLLPVLFVFSLLFFQIKWLNNVCIAPKWHIIQLHIDSVHTHTHTHSKHTYIHYIMEFRLSIKLWQMCVSFIFCYCCQPRRRVYFLFSFFLLLLLLVWHLYSRVVVDGTTFEIVTAAVVVIIVCPPLLIDPTWCIKETSLRNRALDNVFFFFYWNKMKSRLMTGWLKNKTNEWK